MTLRYSEMEKERERERWKGRKRVAGWREACSRSRRRLRPTKE